MGLDAKWEMPQTACHCTYATLTCLFPWNIVSHYITAAALPGPSCLECHRWSLGGGVIVAWVPKSFSEPSLLLIAHFIPLTPWRVFVTLEALLVFVGCLVVSLAIQSKASHFISETGLLVGRLPWCRVCCVCVWAVLFRQVCCLTTFSAWCYGLCFVCSAWFVSECNIIFSLPVPGLVLNRRWVMWGSLSHVTQLLSKSCQVKLLKRGVADYLYWLHSLNWK